MKEIRSSPRAGVVALLGAAAVTVTVTAGVDDVAAAKICPEPAREGKRYLVPMDQVDGLESASSRWLNTGTVRVYTNCEPHCDSYPTNTIVVWLDDGPISSLYAFQLVPLE